MAWSDVSVHEEKRDVIYMEAFVSSKFPLPAFKIFNWRPKALLNVM